MIIGLAIFGLYLYFLVDNRNNMGDFLSPVKLACSHQNR